LLLLFQKAVIALLPFAGEETEGAPLEGSMVVCAKESIVAIIMLSVMQRIMMEVEFQQSGSLSFER